MVYIFYNKVIPLKPKKLLTCNIYYPETIMEQFQRNHESTKLFGHECHDMVMITFSSDKFYHTVMTVKV